MIGWRGAGMLVLRAALLCLVVLGPAQAQTRFMAQTLPAELNPAGRAWLSVGRLDIGQGGFCTVTLIAEDQALTAAHCLADVATGAQRPLAPMRVRLGLRNGRPEVERGVRAVRLAWQPGADQPPRIAQDLGLIFLDSPVRLPQVPPLDAAALRLAEGETVSVVSYARGRSELPALQEACRVTSRRGDGVLVLDCEVDHGASGAPVIAQAPGRPPRVVAVISARAQFDDGTERVLAAPLDTPAARALFAEPQAPAPGPRVRRPGEGPASGARFVRP